MFQAQNKETVNSTENVAVSFKIIMTTSVTRPCFSTQQLSVLGLGPMYATDRGDRPQTDRSQTRIIA